MTRSDAAPLVELFYRINLRQKPPGPLVERAFSHVLSLEEGPCRELFLGSLLTGLMSRGPTVEEICALVRTAMSRDGVSGREPQELALPPGTVLIGVAGSGKKGLKTINVSTPAALVAASAGAFVAKVGSRSTSSMSGAVDFAEAVGIRTDLPAHAMGDILASTGFGLFDVSRCIPRFDRVYGGRFHAPTPLSFALPALLCPVRYDVLLYGLAHPDVELSLKALRELGVSNAMIVSSTHDDVHFVDEANVVGTTRICGMRDGMIGRILIQDVAAELNLPLYHIDDVAEQPTTQDNIEAAVAALRDEGTRAHRDVICVNAANIMYLAALVNDMASGYSLARHQIVTGAAWDKVREVAALTAPASEGRR
jgi:anthranilate phosphoribosyltransferase